MSNNLYMPFHPGDYHADTAHLRSAAEHGAYMLLLMNYWQAGKPLPSDDRKLAAIARVSVQEWADMRDTMREFFDEREGLLYHKRVDVELEKARAKSQAAREAVNNRKTNPPKNARSTPDDRPINTQSSNQVQDQEQEQKAANAASAPGLKSLEQECRDLVGEEPVLLALDFHKLQTLVESGAVTEADVKDGIRSAMAKPDFRIRHWSQLEGWARGAAKARMETRAKASGKPIVVSMTPEARAAALANTGRKWVEYDTPEWGPAADRYKAEHGKYPPHPSGGWYFPESYFPLSEAAA